MFVTRVHPHRFCVFAVLAGSAILHAAPEPLPRDEPTVASLLALGPDRFRAYDTDHFTIVTDAPYETIRPLNARLEGIHSAIMRFCAAMKLPVKPPPIRLPILLFDRFDDFTAYASKAGLAPGSAAGFYDQSTNVAAFANVLNSPTLAPVRGEIESLTTRLQALSRRAADSTAADPPASPLDKGGGRGVRDDLLNHINALRSQQDAFVERFNRLVLQHEAAHQVFFNVGVHLHGAVNPFWLVEGLACQFEVPQSDLGGDLKRINQMRLGDLRDALHAAPDVHDESKVDWRGAFHAGPLIPFADLVTADPRASPLGQGGGGAGGDSAAAARYAQVWSLVYFLQRERRDAFSAYLGRLARRAPGQTFDSQQESGEFHALFGRLDDSFTSDWARFTLRLRHEPNGP
ncbi:MAG: DUF1570 domain-containing protein [Phycisphaerales bacterium]|nr:DUF1570 domain-containing protein [Phycisphaerales bacterium]